MRLQVLPLITAGVTLVAWLLHGGDSRLRLGGCQLEKCQPVKKHADDRADNHHQRQQQDEDAEGHLAVTHRPVHSEPTYQSPRPLT